MHIDEYDRRIKTYPMLNPVLPVLPFSQFSGAGRLVGNRWYAALCGCTHQQTYVDVHDKRLTALMTMGAMLSTSATPPRILFFVESVYIRRVVNAGISRQ